MELVLIRHGRSTADDDNLIEGGGYDAPLSVEGRRQAGLLTERLTREGYRFDVLFSSPLQRAREVAETSCQRQDAQE
jgi:broad specificity phosphatase PhoE